MKKSVWYCWVVFAFIIVGSGTSVLARTWDQYNVLFSVLNKNSRKGYIKQSVDGGETWNTVWDAGLHARTRENRLTDIAYGDGTLVAVGNTILSSNDGGETWKETVLKNYEREQMFSSGKPLKAVVFGDGLFVVVGPNHVLYSADGFNWKYVRFGKLSEEEEQRKKAKIKGEYPPDITKNLMFPLDVVYVNGLFWVTGGSRDCVVASYSMSGDKLVLDKKIKLSKQYGEFAKLVSGGLKSTAFDGRTNIVSFTNSDRYAYSSDLGVTWNFAYTPEQTIGAAIVFANETWVAASKFSKIYFTNDISGGWFKSDYEGIESSVNNLVFVNDSYFLAANDGIILRSFDGKSWEIIYQGEKNYDVRAIAGMEITVGAYKRKE